MARMDDIAPHYDSAAAAQRYYPKWEEAGHFRGDPAKPGPAYSIVIPPPNVTGSLHMGHALNNTLQDILTRYKRMDGYNVVWIPGFDHASIAVHWVLERELRAQGQSRQSLGREAFLERAHAFKEKSQANILAQQRRLGIGCDWARQRFTLDAGVSTAVNDVFVKLYEDGLIYRDEQLVNWDPISQTTLSDLEVIHDENVKGELWSFAYPLSSGDGEIVVATTRPETMLGDTAVAVHPDDARYKHLIGKTVAHPLLADRHIPIVGDAILVDPKFGTGVVKITPAHDFNDFAVGKRHKLECINILNKDGTLNEVCGAFKGMTVAAARTAVKEKLAEMGLERGSEPHTMNIGRSERSGAVVEPMMSTQWYVRARPLAAPARAAVEHGFTKFIPAQWENTYFAWLRDIRDWCISRQLWWGQRIPAWYCDSCPHITVARQTPEACGGCAGKNLRQDDDVLDTWFSSATWPFSTMGWPEKTPELKRWYPTAALVTSFDIIFFWVARMMMFGQYFMGEVPFKDVYMHALIRDAEGEKMSKTKGNVVDPLGVIDVYGVDAFRFTLAAFAGQGRDVRWDEARAAGYNKFVNKIWQSFRFVMSHMPEGDIPASTLALAPHSVYDHWILQRLGAAVGRVRDALDNYKFNEAAAAIYGFIWDEFCDWYLEIAKPTLYGEDVAPDVKNACRATLLRVLNGVSRVLHPFMPFLSEELWQLLPGTEGTVMLQPFPKPQDYKEDPKATAEANFVTDMVVAVRRLRAEFGVAPKDIVELQVRGTDAQMRWVGLHGAVLLSLCKAKATPLAKGAAVSEQAASTGVLGAEIFLPLEGLIDFDAERARLTKEMGKTDKERERLSKQLGNADFVARAPAEVVDEKRALLVQIEERIAQLKANIARLK